MYHSIPTDFTGLLYAPNNENGVILLMGLLWKYLPYKFVMEEFEIDPKRKGYSHSYRLDARGKQYIQGKWKDVTFEFKLYSSGLLREIKKYPKLWVDFLVCWEHDAKDLSLSVGQVVSLKEDVFLKLPEDRRRKILLYPEYNIKIVQSTTTIAELLKRFSDRNRDKAKYLLTLWPNCRGGISEIRFLGGPVVYIRVSAYTKEELTITRHVPDATRKRLIEQFGAKQLKDEMKIPLNSLDFNAIDQIVRIIKESVKK
jgi:hypothetical protein